VNPSREKLFLGLALTKPVVERTDDTHGKDFQLKPSIGFNLGFYAVRAG
jgi:hypothetical protein